MINGGDQRRRAGFDGHERRQVDGCNRRRGKWWEMLKHVVSNVKSCGDVKKLCATKSVDNTERKLVHTLAHAIVFIVLICYL